MTIVESMVIIVHLHDVYAFILPQGVYIQILSLLTLSKVYQDRGVLYPFLIDVNDDYSGVNSDYICIFMICMTLYYPKEYI